MPSKYAKTKKPVKRQNKKKVNTFTKNFRMGDYHQRSMASYNHIYTPNASSRVLSNQLTTISKGELLDERTSNLIYIQNLQYTELFRNLSGTQRTVRVMVVSLRGSVNAADVVNWGDLYMDQGFAKSSPSGEDYDAILRINQDEYVKIYDKMFKLNGVTSGESSSRMISLNIPIKKYVSYVYNSSQARKNSIYVITAVSEAAGITPSITAVDSERRWTMHYHDVIRSGPI